MPAKKPTQPKQKPESSAEDTPAEASAEPADGATPEPDAETETEADRPLNRAERRARGKTTTQAQPSFRGKSVGAHGPAHTQRMWSNRRSGG